jgi:histidinol dehydrogenase
MIPVRVQRASSAAALLHRTAQPNPKVFATVQDILENVRTQGDAAVIAYTRKFDRVRLTPQTLRLRTKPVRPEAQTAKVLNYALRNIREFSEANLPRDWSRRNREGALVGEQYRPFDAVGINVPGYVAPLASTALMTVALAKTAGVPRIVVNTPPAVNPVLHYALVLAGATEIYQVGGAQAMGMLAYGTKTVAPVQKLFGPGNAYVTEAKRQLVGAVAIDQLPGPSEIAVVADDTARPDFVAADLLAQAEHGPGSQILLLTPSQKLLKAVLAEMEKQLPALSRQKYLLEVLAGSRFVLTRDLAEAIVLVEAFAPEHLSLVVKNGRSLAGKIKNSGAIFIGNHSPVAAGDYVAGPSHTLPTGGAAKSFAGLTVDQFFKRTSVVEYSPAAIRKAAPVIEALAMLEKLDAHAQSVRIRR